MSIEIISNSLETERLNLKLVDIEDAGFIYDLYNQPRFLQFIGDRKIRSVQDAARYIIEKFRPQIESLGYGNYVVIRKEDGTKLGSVGVFTRDGLNVQDIGFAVLPQFEGFGYFTEAAMKVLEVIHAQFGVSKVSGITALDHYALQNVLQKLGLKYIKLIRLSGEDEDLMYFEGLVQHCIQ
ncbi:GNAT family N-acetyltransferase [Chryseobacterium sp. 6424]|uniref:GNAT family N-acetyltransferase n=1 Tax=Chryseobacterium sp. 6424 TaxID=2039166 RepID=UPI000EFCD828|nr:GNAT family N-acetyltransferase [Chryseobacterium sp. 6424]AYO56738.1 GNAT family N-acetyltransferase [Chryseobacterium sp. 6424]